MDTAARLGFWHTLIRVHAAFEFEPGKHVPAADRGARLFEAAKAGLGEVEDLEPPSPQRSVSLVHAEKDAGEQCRFFSPGACTDFEYRVTLIVGILRQERPFYPLLEAGETLPQGAQLVLGERLQLQIFTRLGHIRQRREIVLGAAQRIDALNDRAELAVFLR